jgi:hypothetical protein
MAVIDPSLDALFCAIDTDAVAEAMKDPLDLVAL